MEPQSFSAGEPKQVLAAARERGDMQRRGFKHRSASPLQQAGSTPSSWLVGSAYQMVLHDHGMVNVTYYHTNQALAETGFTGLVQPTGSATGVGPGFSYALDSFVRVYTSMYVAQGQRPAYSITMWISPPLWSRLK